MAISAARFPGPLGRDATDSTYIQLGTHEMSVDAFGPVAISQTQGGAVAFAMSEAMPFVQQGTRFQPRRGTDEAVLKAAHGETVHTMEPHPVWPAKIPVFHSIGAARLPTNALGQSQLGDGPNAVASAGNAVAASYAGKVRRPLCPGYHGRQYACSTTLSAGGARGTLLLAPVRRILLWGAVQQKRLLRPPASIPTPLQAGARMAVAARCTHHAHVPLLRPLPKAGP